MPYKDPEKRREAARKASKRYAERHPEKVKKRQKAWYAKSGRKYHKGWSDKNREKKRVSYRKWREENLEKARRATHVWEMKNKEHKKEYSREYLRNRRNKDINFKLAGNLRSRLRMALVNNQKAGSAIRDLGCSIFELKKYLECRFEPDMSWDNYGAWHIDHIRPLAKFDLTNRVQFLEACHYTNLQPLWACDNLTKGANG